MVRVRPKVVLLAAYENEDGTVDETTYWLEQFDFSRTLQIDGVDGPVYVDTDRQVALVVTGIGNVEAAASVGALVASPSVDHEESYFLTVGSAGAAPDVETLGSVVINDRIVDWDQKHRLSVSDHQRQRDAIDTFSFKTESAVCKRCDEALVAAASELGSQTQLADSELLADRRDQYPFETARTDPSVTIGTSISGSEFWHGERCTQQAQRLADAYGVGPVRTAEMEGFGTALALDRRDLLDRYVSVRGISNFVQPHPNQDVRESIDQMEPGIETCLENVCRVGSALVDQILADWDRWRAGVPSQFETVRA